jgi:hypothetical protein
MKFTTVICIVALIANVADAFTSAPSPRRALISSRARSTAIKATASDEEAPKKKKKAVKKKKATKKAATKKTVAAKTEMDAVKKVVKKKEVVETFRKPEFVASIAEKTGMSKADSEAALAAVLETITEVSCSI